MKKITFYILNVLFSIQVVGQNVTPIPAESDMINHYISVSSELKSHENVTSNFVSKLTKFSNQSEGIYSLAIMGSSVPWGQGADIGKGYAQLFAQWLTQKAIYSWNTKNISVPGNSTTDVLNRWNSDFLTTGCRFIFYGLSLGNEGIHEKGQTAFDSYRDNMQILINRAREAGKTPLMGNNYPRADFDLTDYNYLKKMNLLIHEWDVPSVNFLGAIDDGSGHWVTSCQADYAHPNTAGHAEMYYAIVPSLMDALAEGKPQPVKDGNTYYKMDKNVQTKRISWTPENITHSFTLSFDFKTTSYGILASFQNDNLSTSQLRMGADGKLYYETQSIISKLKSPNLLNDGQWHTVSLTHYYARGRTFLYVDGLQINNTSIVEKLVPVRFHLNDFTETVDQVDFRELFFHRSAMNADEITALHTGKMLKSSLEIYAPLNGAAETEYDAFRNLAQSLNKLSVEIQNSNSVQNLSGNFFDSEEVREIALHSINGQKHQNLSDDIFVEDKENSNGVYFVKATDNHQNLYTRKVLINQKK